MFRTMTCHARKVLWMVALLAIALAGLPPADPAQAVTASTPKFKANCSLFHLEIAVNGTFDDGGGLDKFRYLVTDGNGKKLYVEDAARRVGVTAGSNVANFSYDNDGVDGPPQKNPIRFFLIDLDANNTQVAVLQQATFNANCLPPEVSPNPALDYVPPRFLKAVFVANAELFQEPGRGGIGLQVQAGKEHYAVYRSPDNLWVAVDVSGDQLVWVSSATVQVDLNRLNTPPLRIDGADPTIPTSAAIGPGTGAVIVPGAVTTAIVNTRLRLRAAPSLRAAVLARIPAETIVPVFGRNGARNFVKVSYQGLTGWVSVGFITLLDATVAELPVVE